MEDKLIINGVTYVKEGIQSITEDQVLKFFKGETSYSIAGFIYDITSQHLKDSEYCSLDDIAHDKLDNSTEAILAIYLASKLGL